MSNDLGHWAVEFASQCRERLLTLLPVVRENAGATLYKGLRFVDGYHAGQPLLRAVP